MFILKPQFSSTLHISSTFIFLLPSTFYLHPLNSQVQFEKFGLILDISLSMPMTNGLSPVVSLSEGLPDGFEVRPFPGFDRLQVDAEEILRRLQETGDGNQWILLVGLSAPTIEKLGGKEHPLGGVNYRFQCEGRVGLVKVIPGYSHAIANHLIATIDCHVSARTNPPRETKWTSTTMYMVATTKGRHGDQTFLPLSRYSPHLQTCQWPTLVIETGVPQSTPRLREHAKWWFTNSKGDVRIVLIIIVSHIKVRLEKWQLAPPGFPRPLTRECLDSLRLHPAQVPLMQQVATTQQPYSAQEIEVTSRGVVGAPLVLPFSAVYDEPAGPGEGDIFIGAQELSSMMSYLL